MRFTKRRVLLALAICLLLAVSLGLAAAAGETMPRSLFGSGGGTVTNGEFKLQAALAQPVAATVANESILCAGFYCGTGVTETSFNHTVYLPTVIKP
jgi:hypothetical protein